jgi:histidyl-tRNA synthetase
MWLWAERIMEAMIDAWIKLKNKDEIALYFIALGDEAKKIVLPLSIKAREAWINTELSLWSPSLATQMKKANKIWAKYVVIVWIMEARNWIFQVRNMEDWTQEEIKKEEVLDYIINKIWKENLNFYTPLNDLILD